MATLAIAGPRWGEKTCPEFEPMTGVDLKRYAGRWYEIVRDRATPFELLMSCVTADYSIEDDGTLGVTNSGYRNNNGWSSSNGIASPAGDGLKVSFEGMPEIGDEPNYFVLDTDYETYSVVYSCGNFAGLFTFDMLWVLARDPELTQEKMLVIKEGIYAKLPGYPFARNAKYTKQGDQCSYEDQLAIVQA